MRIEYDDSEVRVSVTNQDLGRPGAPGLGITGMQRRAAAAGGICTAGPGDEPGTFRVAATFPRSWVPAREVS